MSVSQCLCPAAQISIALIPCRDAGMGSEFYRTLVRVDAQYMYSLEAVTFTWDQQCQKSVRLLLVINTVIDMDPLEATEFI